MKTFKHILIFLALTSCIREIEYPVDNAPQRLVINSLLQANRLIKVNVSTLVSIFDTTYHFVDDAEVLLQYGCNIDTLKYLDNGNYISHTIAKEDQVYSLTVFKENYPTVIATDTVPAYSRILKATQKETDEVDEYGSPIIEYSISFKSKYAHQQWYELMIIEQSKKSDENTFQISFNVFDIELDPIIQQTGINNVSNTYFFSTAGISDENYTLKMKMQSGWATGGRFKDPLIPYLEKSVEAIVLRTVSKSYVDYRISWEKHYMLKQDSSKIEDLIFVPIIGPQQEMFSNVENGLGVFVSYAQSSFILN